MERRKVQMTGGSSYIISLPKSWVKEVGIKKNDSVGIEIQEDKSLLIIPPGGKRIGKREKKTFRVEEFSDADFLMRCLIGAYISGYREISIVSEEQIPSWVRDTATKFSRTVIGQEIINEDARRIELRDILDPTELPFEKILRRMQIIVMSMYEDSLRIVETRNSGTAEEVIRRDSEIDRLHWLIAREQSMAYSDPAITRAISSGGDRCIDYFQISRIIERIGDHTVRVATRAGEIVTKIDEATSKVIVEAGKYALRMFDMSLKAYREKDIFMAERMLEQLSSLKKMCEKINTAALRYSTETAISLGYIAESIRRTGEYSADLCEYVIDYFI